MEFDERLETTRKIWPKLTKEQQDLIEEFLEQIRKRIEETSDESDVRPGESETFAERRPTRVEEMREGEPAEATETSTPDEEKVYEDTSTGEETDTSTEIETLDEYRARTGYRPPSVETLEEQALSTTPPWARTGEEHISRSEETRELEEDIEHLESLNPMKKIYREKKVK